MAIEIAETIEQARAAVARARSQGRTVGLVPTMGALHDGHASLVRQARAEAGFVVVTVFVNPMQFGPHEDLKRYPQPLTADLQVCECERADLVFHPDIATVYPAPFHAAVEVGGLSEVLEGASRPGHFRGVATIVLKLFNIVQPDVAYFGQKDAQQFRVIEQMVRDLNVPVALRLCPIVRTADGLALSSRNVYLDAAQRQAAPVLYRALEELRQAVEAGERRATELTQRARDRIAATPGARLDYLEAVEFTTFRPVAELRGRVLVAAAVYFGTTRLIDNILIDVP